MHVSFETLGRGLRYSGLMLVLATGCAAEVEQPEDADGALEVDVSTQAITFDSCSPERQQRAQRIIIRAKSLANKAARSYSSGAAAKYDDEKLRWFGLPRTNLTGHYNTIASTFQRIATRLATENYVINCDSKHPSCFFDDGSEWVARAQGDGGVRLCEPFWNFSDNGSDWDNTTAVLLHELSHFEGTEDLVYSVDEVLALAGDDPFQAARNASSYEYYYVSIYGL